ncbi:hypothetical protein [Bradyrhizobium sp.]|uniref:hypothetical protein n=1 Tax=Bradyrhizobium sp. TaxID=376 RepID=UPI001EBC330A|nr:hypothetical protein [Bradyrhizobium sp.]MBV8919395.1 hypothetical protein [Bradyrhizobium sp.]MBV9982172.1 hypothetical protein [Bradyrhizobium sp.]
MTTLDDKPRTNNQQQQTISNKRDIRCSPMRQPLTPASPQRECQKPPFRENRFPAAQRLLTSALPQQK